MTEPEWMNDFSYTSSADFLRDRESGDRMRGRVRRWVRSARVTLRAWRTRLLWWWWRVTGQRPTWWMTFYEKLDGQWVSRWREPGTQEAWTMLPDGEYGHICIYHQPKKVRDRYRAQWLAKGGQP